MKIVIATFNLGKLKEFRSLFKNSKFEVIALNDLSSEDIEETGKSYEENALLKAKAAAKKTSLLAIGDDSGLEVSSLKNDPGCVGIMPSSKAWFWTKSWTWLRI